MHNLHLEDVLNNLVIILDFIVIDEYRKLLKPIISRFCNIQVPLPNINKKIVYMNLIKNNTNNL